ncbi:unnamed protein product, partial [Ectocarpus sp. 8 AP-2014]
LDGRTRIPALFEDSCKRSHLQLHADSSALDGFPKMPMEAQALLEPLKKGEAE